MGLMIMGMSGVAYKAKWTILGTTLMNAICLVDNDDLSR